VPRRTIRLCGQIRCRVPAWVTLDSGFITHLGLAGTNISGLASPSTAVRLAILAEELGYESLWTSEHIVLPDLPFGEHRWSADLRMLDSLLFLGHIAAVTRRIRLATGILLLPQHEPRLLAKQVDPAPAPTIVAPDKTSEWDGQARSASSR
jgi:Luciferase-like monooxygenase